MVLTIRPLRPRRAQCTRTENCASRSCTNRARTSTGTRTPERGGCPSTRSSRSCVSLFPFLSLPQKDDWFLAESARIERLPIVLFARETAHLGHLVAEPRHSRYQLARQRRRRRTSLLALDPHFQVLTARSPQPVLLVGHSGRKKKNIAADHLTSPLPAARRRKCAKTLRRTAKKCVGSRAAPPRKGSEEGTKPPRPSPALFALARASPVPSKSLVAARSGCLPPL